MSSAVWGSGLHCYGFTHDLQVKVMLVICDSAYSQSVIASLKIFSIVSAPKESAALDESEEIHDLNKYGRGEEAMKRERWISIYLLCFLAFLTCASKLS